MQDEVLCFIYINISGCSAVGSALALGKTADRCRWQMKGGRVGAAVKIFRRSKPKKILGTARGRAKQAGTGLKSLTFMLNWIFRGVAQLVARLLWEQDAGCSSHLTPTIKVNIRWYKEVISLRGDFFVCKSRKSFIYKGFRLFLFLWSVLCCPWKPSRNCLLLCTGFQRLLFWNLLLPWGFHSEYKVLHGFKTL